MSTGLPGGPAPAPLVLNVDDQAPQRYATSRVLRHAGFRVEEADSGAETLRLVDLRPDVIVLDVNLGDMSGFEVVRRLKQAPETAPIPVLHLTATHASAESWTTALESGADAFLVSPVEPAVLVATIRALLRTRRAEMAVREQWEVLETVTRVGQLLAAELDPRRVLQAVSDAVRDLTHARYGAVVAFPPQGGRVTVLAATGVRGDDLATSLRVSFVSGVPRVEGAPAVHLSIPIVSRTGQVSGLLVAGDPPAGVFPPSAETLLRGLAGQTATALDNARLFEESQQLYRQAMEANRLKDEFLATLSHELRTPLNAIVGWAYLLRAGRLDAGGVARAVDTITRNAEMQNQLISDILDVSRIVAGKLRLELQAVDVPAVIDAAVDTVRPAADAKNIRVERIVDVGLAPITGDPHRLQQVTWNLLSNAIKFTPKGGRVQVRLEMDGSQLRLTVTDSGPGIAPEFLPHVFERFRQADASTTRPHAGLGLGLAIVRHLVEMHGGSVDARNGPGGGAVFTVTIPRRAVTGEAPAATERTAAFDPLGLRGVRFLVVDDDADGRELVRTVLEAAGGTVVVAASAAEGLGLFDTERPHVVVSDIEMPGEDGYALMRAIRARPPDAGGLVPAVALTAYATTQDRLDALRAGYQAHLAKPVQPDELVAAAASLVPLSPAPRARRD